MEVVSVFSSPEWISSSLNLHLEYLSSFVICDPAAGSFTV